MREPHLWSHDIELDARPVSASQARAFVRLHLVAHGMEHLSNDVALVASELATNAMTHARTRFTVSLSASELRLLLEVQDGSPAVPAPVTAGSLDSHGRGISIVARLCHDWGVDVRGSGGKSVWAAFSMRQR
jgi:anti-sigma regulatory factor (Ser/Thr protein kinase)